MRHPLERLRKQADPIPIHTGTSATLGVFWNPAVPIYLLKRDDKTTRFLSNAMVSHFFPLISTHY